MFIIIISSSGSSIFNICVIVIVMVIVICVGFSSPLVAGARGHDSVDHPGLRDATYVCYVWLYDVCILADYIIDV